MSELSQKNLLPSNSTPLERALESAPQTGLPDGTQIKTAWQVGRASDEILATLAWTLSVDGWQGDWPSAIKRQAIRNSYELHAKKGTPWAVRRVLETVGFGVNSNIIEGSQVQLYDGTLFADGSQSYGGANWAEYRIEVDLGEDYGLDARTAPNARRAVVAVAPARCRLTDFGWKADTTDIVDSADNLLSAASLTQSDITPWLKRYDGSLHYDQGAALSYDGAHSYDGQWQYIPSQTQAPTALAQVDNTLTTALEMNASDQQRILTLYDGALLYDGHTEADNLFAEDLQMPITVTQWHRYDGKRTYGDGVVFYDGSHTANGQKTYSIARDYSGHRVQNLTVN